MCTPEGAGRRRGGDFFGLGGGEGHPVVAECDRVVLGAALALCGPRDPVRIAFVRGHGELDLN